MDPLPRLAVFLGGVVLVFGAAFAAGHAVGPVGGAAGGSGRGHEGAAQATAAQSTHSVPGAAGHHTATAKNSPKGLLMSEDGYTLALAEPRLPAGPQTPVRFAVLGPDGALLTSYEATHDKQMHLIAVRRDLTGFQHVHPTLRQDGVWSAAVDLTPGEWRLFADFAPAGHEGLTLGADLSVPGAYDPQPLPAASRSAEVDGYTVTLDGMLMAGEQSKLTLSISTDSGPVTDLQPYLAAYGHLVALRDGDLAYLHVHPDGGPGDGRTPAGPDVTFYVTTPSAGDYRLFLDFRHRDTVRTAEFTVSAGGGDHGR